MGQVSRPHTCGQDRHRANTELALGKPPPHLLAPGSLPSRAMGPLAGMQPHFCLFKAGQEREVGAAPGREAVGQDLKGGRDSGKSLEPLPTLEILPGMVGWSQAGCGRGEGWLYPKHQAWRNISPAWTPSVSSAGQGNPWKLLHHGHSQVSQVMCVSGMHPLKCLHRPKALESSL